MNETTTAAPALDPAIPVGVPFEQLPLRPLIRRYEEIAGKICTYWRRKLAGHKAIGDLPPEVAAEAAHYYAQEVLQARWPDAEALIAKSPEWAHLYARDVIRGRWGKAEPGIAVEPPVALWYAIDLVCGRWQEAEPFLANDPEYAYWYALDVIKGRFEAAEPAILAAEDLFWAVEYAQFVLKCRWIDAEERILASRWADDYRAAFGLADAA